MDYTLADYKILHSFVNIKTEVKNGDSKKGINAMHGMNIKEIMAITGLSSTKVRNTISNMIRDELVEFGVKNRNSNTYIITKKGKDRLIELKGGI